MLTPNEKVVWFVLGGLEFSLLANWMFLLQKEQGADPSAGAYNEKGTARWPARPTCLLVGQPCQPHATLKMVIMGLEPMTNGLLDQRSTN